MNAQRSTAVHNVLSAAPAIFDMPLNPKGFERSYARDDDAAFRALQQFPQDKIRYPMFAPVLFKGQIYKMDLLFRSLILVNVSIHTIFRKPIIMVSLVESSSHIIWRRRTEWKTYSWQVTGWQAMEFAKDHSWLDRAGWCSCEYMQRILTRKDFLLVISFFVYQAKYLVLPDKEFRKVGDKSKVNYAQEYRSFKQFIVSKADTPAMKRTIAFFNKEVFAGTGLRTDVQSNAAEDFADQLADAMAKFGLGDEEDDDDDSDNDGDETTALQPSRESNPPLSIIPEGRRVPSVSDSLRQRNRATVGPSHEHDLPLSIIPEEEHVLAVSDPHSQQRNATAGPSKRRPPAKRIVPTRSDDTEQNEASGIGDDRQEPVAAPVAAPRKTRAANKKGSAKGKEKATT